jgi:AcrR family transcriptional regulator
VLVMPSPNEGVGTRNARPGIGSNGVEVGSRARVNEIQRARLLLAMTEVAAERGLAEATVARVVACAGVSRRTFYELFEDREQCFLAAFNEGASRAIGYVSDTYDPGVKWADRIRSALVALLQFLDLEPAVGRLLIVESLGAGRLALERRQRLLAQAIDAVQEGQDQVKDGVEVPLLAAEGVVGGALSIIHARLGASSMSAGARSPGGGDHVGDSLIGLVNPLMSMIVLPYQGKVASRKELTRPMPKAHASVSRRGSDPLRDLDMRLTYRTVCVLVAVAGTPGCSNREIGEAAGIVDQGQISKLLGRLERLGLVQNSGLRPGNGTPNSWVLTDKGVEVEQAMSEDGAERRVAANAGSWR